MRQPFLIGVAAVLAGLFLAATILVVLKPQDRPLQMPGFHLEDTKREPPVILILGPKDAARHLHLALGDNLEADKRAYHAARISLESNPAVALNLLPAMTTNKTLQEAFAWALAADEVGRESFVDSLMGTTGDITPQVLSLLAQNSGLDPAEIDKRADSSAIDQSMRQAHSVLPPSLPAIFVNGQWLAEAEITPTVLEEHLGIAQSADSTVPAGAHVLATGAYAFATPPTPQTAAVFVSLRNAGSETARIVGAATPVADRAELHNHSMNEGGVMQMRRVETIEIPAGKSVMLNPHGLHIMLFDLPAPLAVGQSFPVSLQLEGGAEILTRVEVLPPGTVLPALTDDGHSG